MKSSTGVHFMSERMDWKTPKAVYQALHAEFAFDHDPCPAGWDGAVDGLTSSWGGANYVNPPYGRELPLWVKKSYEQSQEGKTVVMLIPSRTDTRWWHDYCMLADEIRFIKGRLKFDDQPNPAPFPSCLVIFRGRA
jgi:phage N-6-adenine-methyltransferase